MEKEIQSVSVEDRDRKFAVLKRDLKNKAKHKMDSMLRKASKDRNLDKPISSKAEINLSSSDVKVETLLALNKSLAESTQCCREHMRKLMKENCEQEIEISKLQIENKRIQLEADRTSNLYELVLNENQRLKAKMGRRTCWKEMTIKLKKNMEEMFNLISSCPVSDDSLIALRTFNTTIEILTADDAEDLEVVSSEPEDFSFVDEDNAGENEADDVNEPVENSLSISEMMFAQVKEINNVFNMTPITEEDTPNQSINTVEVNVAKEEMLLDVLHELSLEVRHSKSPRCADDEEKKLRRLTFTISNSLQTDPMPALPRLAKRVRHSNQFPTFSPSEAIVTDNLNPDVLKSKLQQVKLSANDSIAEEIEVQPDSKTSCDHLTHSPNLSEGLEFQWAKPDSPKMTCESETIDKEPITPDLISTILTVEDLELTATQNGPIIVDVLANDENVAPSDVNEDKEPKMHECTILTVEDMELTTALNGPIILVAPINDENATSADVNNGSPSVECFVASVTTENHPIEVEDVSLNLPKASNLNQVVVDENVLINKADQPSTGETAIEIGLIGKKPFGRKSKKTQKLKNDHKLKDTEEVEKRAVSNLMEGGEPNGAPMASAENKPAKRKPKKVLNAQKENKLHDVKSHRANPAILDEDISVKVRRNAMTVITTENICFTDSTLNARYSESKQDLNEAKENVDDSNGDLHRPKRQNIKQMSYAEPSINRKMRRN